VSEPTVTATIIAPHGFAGPVISLATARRGEQLEHTFLGSGSSAGQVHGGANSDGRRMVAVAVVGATAPTASGRVMLRYRLPLSELASAAVAEDCNTQGWACAGRPGPHGGRVHVLRSGSIGELHDRPGRSCRLATLRGALSLPCLGAALPGLDYEEGPLRIAPLVLLELLVNGKPVDALARLVAAQVSVRAVGPPGSAWCRSTCVHDIVALRIWVWGRRRLAQELNRSSFI